MKKFALLALLAFAATTFAQEAAAPVDTTKKVEKKVKKAKKAKKEKKAEAPVEAPAAAPAAN